MACCGCGGPSAGSSSSSSCCCCCCGVCDGDEQLVLQQQKRAESLEELRRMKGVTKTSMTQLAVEQLAVVEAAYSKLGSRNRCLCCYPLQALTRGPLFLALCLFTAALFAINSYPVELNQMLQRSEIAALLGVDYLFDLNTFFLFTVCCITCVISAAFLISALRLSSFLSLIEEELTAAAREELLLDVLPSIQQDFYSFLQRLQQHFVLSEDFNEAAAKRGSRQLQALLHARISLVCLYNKGSPLSARRSIQERVGLLHFLLQLFFFFIPWFVFTCCNCMQLLVFCSQGPWLLPQETAAAAAAAAATTAAAAAGTEMNAPQALQLQQQALASEAASGHIICCFILNASAALYLIILQSNCLQRCFTNCLYSRVHAAIVDLCNRLILNTWEEAVVQQFVDFIKEPKTDLSTRHGSSSSSSCSCSSSSSSSCCGQYIPAGLDTPQTPHSPTAAAAAGAKAAAAAATAAAAAAAAAAADPKDQLHQRLLTAESCGSFPTSHQVAVQAPRVSPHSCVRSPYLSLEPFGVSVETASCPGGFSSINENE